MRISQARGDKTADESEEVSAPRNVIAGNERPGHRTAVSDRYRESDQSGSDFPVEGDAEDEIAEKSEHHAACTDVLRVSFTEQPRSETRDERRHEDDENELDDSAPENQSAENQKRNCIRQQMVEVFMDERRDRNVPQAIPRARNDAGARGRQTTRQKHVDAAHDPHHADEYGQSDSARPKAFVSGEHLSNSR